MIERGFIWGRRKYYTLILLIGIFLVGCSENVEEDLPKEPPEETSKEVGNPPNIRLIVFSDHGTPGTLDKYCWEEEEDDKTCSIEPTPPEERLRGETHLIVAQGAELFLFFPHQILLATRRNYFNPIKSN